MLYFLLLLRFLAVCNALLMPYISCNSKLAPRTHINTDQRCWYIPCRWLWPMRYSGPSPYEHSVWQYFKRVLYLASFCTWCIRGDCEEVSGSTETKVLNSASSRGWLQPPPTFPDVPRWKRVRIQLKFVSMHLPLLAKRNDKMLQI